MISPKSYLWFCKADGWQVTSFDPRIDPALGKPDVKCYVLESDFKKVTEALTVAIEALMELNKFGIEPTARAMCAIAERALIRVDEINTGYIPESNVKEEV